MKTLSTIAAVAIAMTLMLTPMVSSAAGSVTFSSPGAGASYKGSASYTISGTVSPAPTQADQMGITVKNPSGQTVDIASVPVNSGSFTYSTATGGTSAWVTGTYTITATDSYGATGTTSFSYTSTLVSQYNVTKALINIQGNLSLIESELATMQKDNKGNFSALSTSLSSLSQQVTTLSTNLGTVQTDVTNMQGQLTTISNNIASMNSAIQAAQTAAQAAQTAADNANSAVSSTQTYVLVVAVLAAITLVLELAILVRKLS